MTDAERVSIGFSGGGVVEVRIDNAKLKDLRKALEKGEGWYDIDGVLAKLKDAGIEMIDSEPRVGIRESRVAFVHPRSTGGVLTEIVEPAEAH